MITFSTPISNLLQGVSIESFYCVQIGTYRTTSYHSDITVDGNLFLSDGKLVSVDPPNISTEVDREIFKVTLTDSNFQLANTFQSGMVGASFEVKILFINPATNLPYTNSNDILIVYKGIIDNISIGVQPSNIGEVSITVSGASPMNDLDLVKNFYTSKEFIRSRYPEDSCFDQIYEGSGPVNLKWGKG